MQIVNPLQSTCIRLDTVIGRGVEIRCCGGNHVIGSNTALVVSIAHRVYWRQD